MATDRLTEQLHYRAYGRKTRIAAFLFLVVAVLFSVMCRKHGGLLFFGVLFALVGTYMLMFQRAVVVDPIARVVCLHYRLFDRFTLWTRRWPVAAFDAVVRRRGFTSTDSGSRSDDVWIVGLRRCSGWGWIVWICFFYVRPDSPCPASEEVACELSAQMGLPIVVQDPPPGL